MHIALKIGLYALGSMAFLAISNQFLASKNDAPAKSTSEEKQAEKAAITKPTEKAVLNTKVSDMDLDAAQLQRIVNSVTKDASAGTLIVGTKVASKIM